MRYLVPFVALALAAAPAAASADEPVPEKARALAERGRQLHDKGDYANAIAAFKEAYVIAPSTALLFNLAQAYRLQGNCADASLMYRRFLAERPSPEGRALAEGHLATVERCTAKANLGLSSGTAIGFVGSDPHPASPAQVLADTAPTSRATWVVRAGAATTIAGTLGASVAVYYGLRARSASRDVEDGFARGMTWPALRPIHERGERAERNATIFAIGGGVAIAGGVAMFVLGRRAENRAAVAPVAIVPRAGGAELQVGWSF